MMNKLTIRNIFVTLLLVFFGIQYVKAENYVISHNDALTGYHYLSVVSGSLADATTLSPSTSLWEAEVESSTYTLHIGNVYLTLQSGVLGTTTTAANATAFSKDANGFYSGSDYIGFDNDWKTVDNTKTLCSVATPTNIPYVITDGNGNYMGYTFGGGTVSCTNYTTFDPDHCVWYKDANDKLYQYVTEKTKDYYVTVGKNDNVTLEDQAKKGTALIFDSDNHMHSGTGNKQVFIIYNSGWKGSAEGSVAPSNAAVFYNPETYNITDGARYLTITSGALGYSTTASSWEADGTTTKTLSMYNGGTKYYLTLGTSAGNTPSLSTSAGTAFDLTGNHLSPATDLYMGYIGWTSVASTAAATVGDATPVVITDGTNFMTVASGAVANTTTFDYNTCTWTSITVGGSQILAMTSGGTTYYLVGPNGANNLTLTTDISTATGFSISGNTASYTSDGRNYSITYNKGWETVQNGTASTYYPITYTITPEVTNTGDLAVAITYATDTVTNHSSFVYEEVTSMTMQDLGKYYFKGQITGTYNGYPEYRTYTINGLSSNNTYYYIMGQTVTTLPTAQTGWSLTQATGTDAITHLHGRVVSGDYVIKNGTWWKGNKFPGWGGGNYDIHKGAPEVVQLTLGYNLLGVPLAGATVNITVKAFTWKDYITSQPSSWQGALVSSSGEADSVPITCEEDLAWVISLVDGFNSTTTTTFSGQTLYFTRDLDMSEYEWVPLSTHTTDYCIAGNIDGNGYILRGLRCDMYIIPGTEKVINPHLEATRGFIGNFCSNFTPTIKNIFFEDVSIGWPGNYYGEDNTHHHAVGGIVGGSDGSFIVKNCGISGRVFLGGIDGTYTNNVAYVGSIAGYIGGSEAMIESCYSVCEVEGCSVGGLVGYCNASNLKNCFANPIIKVHGTSNYAGGLVGSSVTSGHKGKVPDTPTTSQINNCYVRLRGITLDSGAHFGLFTGTGGADYCYALNTQANSAAGGTGSYPLSYASTITNYGLYNKTTPYKYTLDNNIITKIEGDSLTYDLHKGMQLYKALNNYVTTVGAAATPVVLSSWARSTSDINEDYPIIRFDDFNTIISYRRKSTSSLGNLESTTVNAGPTNELLDPYMYYKRTLAEAFAIANNSTLSPNGAVVDLYFNDDVRGQNLSIGSNSLFYINEDVSFLHDFDISAYVGITLDNDAHNSVGGDVNYDWHMLSTPIVANSVPLGFNYGTDNDSINESQFLQHQFNYWQTTTGEGRPDSLMTHYGWLTEGDKLNNQYFPDDTPYDSCDFYCWTEPEYQWINFKRNGGSHYHEDAPHNQIPYAPYWGAPTNKNEQYLIPGKGYLMAINRAKRKDKTQFMQTYGQLNQGNVTITATKKGNYVKGYNFIGNPYLSYLDFDEFAEENSGLWESGSSFADSYFLLDAEQGGYITYTVGASAGGDVAPRYINMHQGFFIVADKEDDDVFTVTFTDDMRTNESTPNFRGINYPLVNFKASDENGNSEILVVEVERPELGGAKKARSMRTSRGTLYAHYNNNEYSILFTPKGETEVAICFETNEECNYTLNWNTQNGEFQYLHLIDNITGMNIDMNTTNEYMFRSTPDQYKSRFRMVFEVKEEGEDIDNEGSEEFCFWNQGELVVNGEGLFQLIDINGRVVYSTYLSGIQSQVGLPRTSSGVYVVRILNNNSQKMQKIVIN